jgi:hypothetical protein
LIAMTKLWNNGKLVWSASTLDAKPLCASRFASIPPGGRHGRKKEPVFLPVRLTPGGNRYETSRRKPFRCSDRERQQNKNRRNALVFGRRTLVSHSDGR